LPEGVTVAVTEHTAERSSRRVLPVLALGASLLALAGCGGGDRLSAAEYRERASEICRAAERDTRELGSPADREPDTLVDYFEQAMRRAARRASQHRELRPPAALAEDHDQVVALQREGLRTVRALVRDLKDGQDPVRALGRAAPRLQRLGERNDALARRLRLPECVTAERA
jgi:hypothetical protein